MSVRHTDDSKFDAEISAAPLVLVKFTAQWCPPCRALEPVLEKLTEERKDVVVLSVDVDANQQTAQRFGVRSIPTLISFKNGRPAGQLVGALPRAKIDALL